MIKKNVIRFKSAALIYIILILASSLLSVSFAKSYPYNDKINPYRINRYVKPTGLAISNVNDIKSISYIISGDALSGLTRFSAVAKQTPKNEWTIDLPANFDEQLLEDQATFYLKPTKLYNYDNAVLLLKAKEITSKVSAKVDKINEIVKWIYVNLAKIVTIEETPASTILEKMAGDCSEHAVLFISFCRALGIPARKVHGLALDVVDQRFKPHAWAEAYVDGSWIQVDPSWNQTEVDATHISMVHSENEIQSYNNIIDHIMIDVTDVVSK